MPSGSELNGLVSGGLDELAPFPHRVAVCAYGPSFYAKPGAYIGQDLLVIRDKYADGLRTYLRTTEKQQTRFLLVDRSLIESDIERGTLGDFLTEKLIYPYRALANQDYLDDLSLQAARRTVKEEARDLVLNYGEMCRGIVAAPEFFGLSKLRRRARVFVPSLEDYLRLLDPAVRQQNLSTLREAFSKAVSGMGGDGVEFDGENVAFQDQSVDKWLKVRSSEQAVNILRHSQRALYSYLARGRTVFLSPELLARELSSPLRLSLDPDLVGRQPENPNNSLYLRTEEGLVSFNERSSLEEMLSKLRPGRPMTVSPLAGVLNEVYLVTLGRERFVAKRFTDWHGFKWFTLNLVSLGSKLFSVSGKARLTNEYGINRYLAKKGLKVPQVINVNVKQRILVETYISGVPMNEFVSQAIGGGALGTSQYRLAEAFGESLARIHEAGVAVGDAKPENFVAKGDEIYTVDLEQAGKHGDQAWDIAELLFYTGHYSNTATPTRGFTEVVEAFILGYLKAGNARELKRATGARYVRVFSLWTPAPIIVEISRLLREAK